MRIFYQDCILQYILNIAFVIGLDRVVPKCQSSMQKSVVSAFSIITIPNSKLNEMYTELHIPTAQITAIMENVT